ncbi:carbamoyltransferase HypF [Streptomyces mirabilis]|uniref:carbamoyltransferase HypF n=1 Tax=Streptomyces mirabilis TaxID=68239 RepID=UPI00368DBEEF
MRRRCLFMRRGDATGLVREAWLIRVTGVVQGVGYRPFVYRLATSVRLSGWVLNDTLGVLIEACGPESALRDFVVALTERAPPLASVDTVRVRRRRRAEDAEADRGFEVRSSRHVPGASAVTTAPPDAHVCAQCLRETLDPADRRYRYPFTNCTDCGPRYSLIRSLPYDRSRTTMTAFTMCEPCATEYADPGDRRYHAQPNACPDCGPALSLHGPGGQLAEREAALAGAVEALAAGRVVAVKGLGGFHLAVNARDGEAVARLRRRKGRDAKPFAILVRDLTAASEVASYGPDEATLLTSPARPVVLLRKRPGALPEAIAPRLPSLGVMLPCTPLQHLLLHEGGFGALVMTSGNASGRPIVFRNEDALDQLTGIADVFLCHNRDIEVPVDDSVLWCTRHGELAEPVVSLLRRARGYAGSVIAVAEPAGAPDGAVLAYGAQLKATVTVGRDRHALVGQHVGDLDDAETLAVHRKAARHLGTLGGAAPRYAACDVHPDLQSTRLAETSGAVDIVRVQHHHAHMASCMAENKLTGRTLGVVFDGTGLGEDGTVRGGEYLVGDASRVERAAWLRPLRLPGGDAVIREPVRTAFALAIDAVGSGAAARSAFPALDVLDDRASQVLETMVRRGLNTPTASSAGRLFDAVSALLGICPYAEYDAQAPTELEALLERDPTMAEPYPYDLVPGPDGMEIDHRPIVRGIAADLAEGARPPHVSRRFHSTMVSLVVECCVAVGRAGGPRQVVLSGGVFHNEFLTVNCLVELRRAGFAVYTHRLVPCGDGGISLGQVAVASARLRTRTQHSRGTPSA